MNIQACLVCLSTKSKLHSLNKISLKQALTDVTALPILLSDGFPHHICYICYAILMKCVAFKAKCHYTHKLLEEIVNIKSVINYEDLISLESNRLTPLTISKTHQIDIIDGNEEIYVEKFQDIAYFDQDLVDVKEEEPEEIYQEIQDSYLENSVDYQEIINDDKIDEDSNDNITSNKSISTKENYSRTKKRKKKLDKSINKAIKRRRIKKEDLTDSDNEVLANFVKDENLQNNVKLDRPLKKIESYYKFAKKHNLTVTFYNKEEQIKEVLARKELDSYKKARLKCDLCYKGFITDTAFKNHQIVHDRIRGEYPCELCHMYFRKKGARDKHVEEHGVKYTCNQCGEVFTNACLATSHFQFHSGVQFECETCKKVFRKRTTYFNHMRNSHASVACALCGESFVGSQGLHHHLWKSHREALNSNCSSCGVQFKNDEVLKHHIASSCSPNIRACVRCGEGFPNEDLLNTHVREQHKDKRISCDQCEKTFPDEHSLGLHWNKAHSGRSGHRTRAPRQYCAPRDPNQRSQYMCDQCGKSFKVRTNFTFHMRLHTGEKPHQCALCPKTFRLPMSLKTHMSTHTDERPYRCPLCPRAFRQSTHRHTHMRTHTQEKPHSCSVCHKRFSLAANMREHSRTVHEGLPPRQRHKDKHAI